MQMQFANVNVNVNAMSCNVRMHACMYVLYVSVGMLCKCVYVCVALVCCRSTCVSVCPLQEKKPKQQHTNKGSRATRNYWPHYGIARQLFCLVALAGSTVLVWRTVDDWFRKSQMHGLCWCATMQVCVFIFLCHANKRPFCDARGRCMFVGDAITWGGNVLAVTTTTPLPHMGFDVTR